MPRTWRIPSLLLPVLLMAGTAHATSAPGSGPPVETREGKSATVQKRAIDLGAWGEIEVGQTDSPSRRMVATTPVRDPWFVDGEVTGGLDARAAYYSPRVSGFRVGLGYTPIRTQSGDATEIARHTVEGVVRHEGKLGKAKLRLTAGGGKARVTNNGRRTSRKSWVVGGQVATGALTVGAGYRAQMPDDGPSRHTWNAGVQYESGTPARGWSLTGRLAHTKVGDEAPQEAWSTGLRYRMTSRVSLSADLGTMTYGGGPADSTMLLFGTRMVF